jgi:hypothetical protein
MVMRKILFGSIVFFSLAFLAACGGGGSGSSGAAGAAGAAGADGATGATGSIAVPSADTDLAIAAVATDTDITLGQMANTYTVSGLDNVTPESRLKYYPYFGTSSTVKAFAGVGDTATANAVGAGNGPIDSRNGNGGSQTITLTVDINLGAADGSISHLIVCPGNEAGDATSCASLALKDRGFGVAAAATDNRSVMLVGADTTSGSTSFYVLANSSNRDTDSDLVGDNQSSAATITAASKTSAAAPTIGSYSTALTAAAAQVVDFAVAGTTQYLLTSDATNGHLWSRTTGDFAVSLDNVTNAADATITSVLLKSDGTNIIAVSGSGARGAMVVSVNRIDNTTASAQIASVSLTDNATEQVSSYCAATGGGQVLLATDNKSYGLLNAAGGGEMSNTLFYGGAYTGGSLPLIAGDNTTNYYQLDNATYSPCDMAYGNVSGAFWYMTDNGTSGVHGLKTVDNGSTWAYVAEAITGNTDSISLTVDPQDNELVACNNDDGAITIKKLVDNTTWTTLSAALAGVNGTAVDCAYNSDGTQIGMSYISGTAAAQVANFKIFYDE